VPIYEYRCPNGHTFEVFQRMSDPPVSTCEVCGAGPVEKVLFPVAVHFKGKGFYSTDYGRGSRAAKEGDGGASTGKDSSGGDSSTSSSSSEKKSTGGEGGSGSTKKTDSS
jgi:putative FmdB family regulatory protein